MDLLTLLFVALKLMGHIEWSWIWVLSPTIIELSIILIAHLVTYLIIRHKDKEWNLLTKSKDKQ